MELLQRLLNTASLFNIFQFEIRAKNNLVVNFGESNVNEAAVSKVRDLHSVLRRLNCYESGGTPVSGRLCVGLVHNVPGLDLRIKIYFGLKDAYVSRFVTYF